MKPKVLLIGASTGGPSQIKDLLSQIKSLSCTIIIVQHMKEEVLPFFIKDLKESLSVDVQMTPLRVDFSKPSIIVCSHSSVLQKNSGSYWLSTNTSTESYIPDINKLFKSFSLFVDDFDLSVLIMTGIGKDGVAGAKDLKEKGVKIYAQDEKSSPVFGMPKAAYEAGIVDKVMSLQLMKEYFRDL